LDGSRQETNRVLSTPESEDVMAMSEAEPVALLISPFEEDHSTLQQLFQQHGWKLYATRSLDSAITSFRPKAVSVVITERDLAVDNWKDVVNAIAGLRERPLLIVISRLADNRLWAEALNLGVHNVLAKPLVQGEVVRVLTSAWIHQLARQMCAAHKAYREAAADCNKIKAKYGDMLDSVDGTFALHRAAANERRASQMYGRAVKAYVAMVSSSRVPEPPFETES
jgi:ActR/RegA family two-component response regulator